MQEDRNPETRGLITVPLRFDPVSFVAIKQKSRPPTLSSIEDDGIPKRQRFSAVPVEYGVVRLGEDRCHPANFVMLYNLNIERKLASGHLCGPPSERSKAVRLDRISRLPDEVLHDILSFLPTDEAVRTCTLSKRWSHLWASIHTLRFDSLRFSALDRFRRFVDDVIQRRDNVGLQGFHLSIGASPCNVNLWIRQALDHNVRDVSLHIGFVPRSRRFNELFGSLCGAKSLRTLKLTSVYMLDVGRGVNSFQGLTSLHLEKIFSPGSLHKVLSGCPALRNLYMKICVFDEFIIDGSELESLTIYHCLCSGGKMLVSAPSLLRFSFVGERWPLAPHNLPSLDFAHCLLLDWSSISKVLQDVCHARCVALSNYCFQVIGPKEMENFPTFPNLCCLTLVPTEEINRFQARLTAFLISRSPNLRMLVIVCNLNPGGSRFTIGFMPGLKHLMARRFSCQHYNHHLTIEFRNVEATAQQMSLMNAYFKEVTKTIWQFRRVSFRGNESLGLN